MEVFGPVRSRRLGLSLGVNHLPPKTCTYACVYCQLGRTSFMTSNRSRFSEPQQIVDGIQRRIEELARDGKRPDTITFVPNGEPTLDSSLGDMIDMLEPTGIATAVITNASLLWHPGCRAQVMKADIVSIKVDSVTEEIWHTIDRPHGSLQLDAVFNGMHWFAQVYSGKLLTETMLVKGLNDTAREAESIAAFIADLHPDTAYLALPVRPPAEGWVAPPDENTLLRIFDIFQSHIPQVEVMMDLPESGLASGEDAIAILLSTVAVHPLSQADIDQFLEKQELTREAVETLVREEFIRRVPHNGTDFYLRNY